MLRRYAAGSSFGSGGAGNVMSGSDGDVYAEAEPFLAAARGWDFRELFDERVPSDAAKSPLADDFGFFRLNRPIMTRNKGKRLNVTAAATFTERWQSCPSCDWRQALRESLTKSINR